MLTVEGVSKTYRSGSFSKRFKALDSVSISLGPGEVVGLLGESGCGKTTLAKVMMKLTKPDEGRVMMDGVDVTVMPERRFRTMRGEVQMIFQDPSTSMNPKHSVRWSLDEAYRHHGKECDYACMFKDLGLPPDILQRRPSMVSGGELQRVSIMRCLASDPSYLILDEPTSMLDLSVQANIMNMLLSLRDRRGMLLITHDMDLARCVCDRVYIMHQGRIVEEGTAKEVLATPRTEEAKGLMEYFR
ncbi:MAG: dipeptide/oligopeptide/nickel ABC transporter ATP-binding protein [Methanomassiliicoccales archaeon]|nr:dipeptide/oligopeptide/nickel ABC transporter ATP-binding protein [Methanomassiliicoccales archaeon]